MGHLSSTLSGSASAVPGGHRNSGALNIPPRGWWELFIVPKSCCVFNGSLYIAFAFAPAPPLAILELIYTMWEFCYLFNRGPLPFPALLWQGVCIFFFLNSQEGGLTTLLFFSLSSFHFINEGEGALA